MTADQPGTGRRPGLPGPPIIVVAPPGAGGPAVADALAASPAGAAIPNERQIMRKLPALDPANRGWDSDRLTASDVFPEVARNLRAGLAESLPPDPREDLLQRADPQRPVLAAPRLALGVRFMAQVLPQARFVYVHREPREALPRALAAWESGAWVSHPKLPDWDGPPWSLPLTPEWRRLSGKELPEVVAEQWQMTLRIAIEDLDELEPDRWSVLEFDTLLDSPQSELQRLCGFLAMPEPEKIPELPDTQPTGEQRARIDPLIESVRRQTKESRDLIAEASDPAERSARKARREPLRSVSTASMQKALDLINGSLLVTTYQTGRLVSIRRSSAGINTHFRVFDSPMGLALRGGRLAVGTRSQIFEYQNLPDLTSRLEPSGAHDACYVPRRSHYTGDIRIHEIDYVGDELWIVATRFSCLGTLDGDHSFVPRWKPPFISELAAEDRCHLNGMCVVEDRVKYVTALGTADTAGGWRERKADGGVIIDVETSETVVEGLSMPHSPRWYKDQLWVLESGQGALARVDPETGSKEIVAELPGFTRGLSFAGDIAFIGLSEVRESATFGGLPLTARLEKRECGVWMVDITSGETVGFLRFEGQVEELFEVMILPGVRFPEIVEHGSDLAASSFVLPNRGADVPTKIGELV